MLHRSQSEQTLWPRLVQLGLLCAALCWGALMVGCSMGFPPMSSFDELDAGPEIDFNQDDVAMIDDVRDSHVRPPMQLDLGLTPDADRREPPSRVCAIDWPEVCQIDCNNEPGADRLLWVRGGTNHALNPGEHNFVCVVVEGTLAIVEYASIAASVFALGPNGRIDGVGGGPAGNGSLNGREGGSQYGRGGGGGGGSGVCAGGRGGPLTDGTESARSGNTNGGLSLPGGRGGDGGDIEGFGGDGGHGGASLLISADRCVLAGYIDLSGVAGQKPLNSDGGGGGGGASGNLLLSCRHLSLQRAKLILRLNGGFGGRGGWVSADNTTWSGGGGGGGAAGALEVRALTATIDSIMVSPLESLPVELQAQIVQQPGLGGEPGLGGDVSERGQNGSSCSVTVVSSRR